MGKRLLLAICSLFLVISAFSQQLKDVIVVDIPLNCSKTSAVEKLKQKGFELKEREEKGDRKTLRYVKSGGYYGPTAMVTLVEKDKRIVEIRWGCSNINQIRLELEEELDISPYYTIRGKDVEFLFYHWKGKTIKLEQTDEATIQAIGGLALEFVASGWSDDTQDLNDFLKFPHDIVILSDEDAQKMVQQYKIESMKEQQRLEREEQQRYNDSLMVLRNIDSIYSIVDEMPEFPGGEGGKMAYLAKNFNYPESARYQGRVLVGFVVEPDGSISNVEVISGIGGDCDEELVRVVKSMPKWKPGKKWGIAVRVRSYASMSFVLND
ncbi:MAG: energy transducer TonB [Bacteroidales bacterium]|nr:energy transducer TonB [Bacteroidales bacterium]